jgi:hypothetical protein
LGLIGFASIYFNGLLAILFVFVVPGVVLVRFFDIPSFPQRWFVVTPNLSVRLTSFLRGLQPLASRLWPRFCDAESMKSCLRSHASKRAAALPSATPRSSDVWMVLPGKFRSNQPLPPLDFAIRRNCYVRRRVPDCP